MDDLISRRAAVYIASGHCHPANIADELRKLPSAEPERKKGKWIPVSERLPEKDGRYLVAYWLMKDYMWMSIAWFGEAVMPNRPMHGRYFYINGEYGEVVWDNVLAWMPLPEPYKGARTSENNNRF